MTMDREVRTQVPVSGIAPTVSDRTSTLLIRSDPANRTLAARVASCCYVGRDFLPTPRKPEEDLVRRKERSYYRDSTAGPWLQLWRRGLAKLLRLALNLQSFCLTLLSHWDYRHTPFQSSSHLSIPKFTSRLQVYMAMRV
ncbi:uncharacterized protein LOC144377998 [Ictidomys tridecemlineatus]